MAMDWFRLYSEFASDPKVQTMNESMQRRLVMLMCMRCSNVTVTLQDDEIAFALRISDDELAQTKALFIKKGFIGEDWDFVNWDKRQYVSDSSAARVAKHRSKKKGEAKTTLESDVTTGNVTVTPPDTEQSRIRTDSESDSESDSEPEQTHSNGDSPKPGGNQNVPVVTPTGAVALSIQFRDCGVRTQPANPLLIKLAEKGVTPETVRAACEEAKMTKGDEPFSLGYVVAILERWGRQQIADPAIAVPTQNRPNQKFNPTLYVNKGRRQA